MTMHPIIKEIKESNYFPKVPQAFGEILNMLLNPYEFNIDECVDRLSEFPELEKALIETLNFNSKLNREILSLKDAVLYLGAKNTKIISIAYITKLLLPKNKKKTELFDRSMYWKHCVGTSIASSMIADKTDLCDKDKIFTYGLMHDIGITVLDICLPEYLDKIYKLQLKGVHQIAAEKVVLKGITHTEIGVWMCKGWGLPEEVTEIIKYHHTPFINSQISDKVKIMHLGDAVSTNYYENLLGNNSTFMYSTKIRESLDLSEEFIKGIVKELPKEVNKINRIIDFNF